MKKGCSAKSERGGERPRTVRRIELSKRQDYGPADSDISVADFSHSEPDSEDDAFIGDGRPFFAGLAHLLANNHDSFEM